MANLQLLLEAERRGILPPDKAALLQEARKRGLVPGTKAAPPQPETTSNPFKGLVARGAELLGSGVELAARAGESIGDFIAEKAPVLDTRVVADKEGVRVERPSLEEVRKENQMQYMFDWANSLREWGRDINYEPSTKLGDLADNPLTAVPFIVERVITSAPDMAAAVTVPIPYIATRSNEILNERLANDNKTLDQATVADVAAATGAAIVEGSLERFATGRLLEKGAEAATRVGRIGKEAGVQAGTEATEETAAYAGATAGTEAGFDPRTAGLTALEAAIVGGGLGAGVQGVRELVGPGETPPEVPPVAPATTTVTPPTAPTPPPAAAAVPASKDELLDAPPKVAAEDAPENVRYEVTTLNNEQINDEIDKLEDTQEQLAELLFNPQQIELQAALARIPLDVYRNNLQNEFDRTTTKIDVFYKHLNGTLPPVKPTITQDQVTAAGVSPDVAKALNVQPTVTPTTPVQPGVSDAAATTAPPITQPPVGGTVGRGANVPPSGLTTQRQIAPETPVAGLEPPARTPSDVVPGERPVEPALEPVADTNSEGRPIFMGGEGLEEVGKPTKSTEEGLANFKRWFGRSKVKDTQDRPIVYYHGSPAGDIQQFRRGRAAAIFASPDPTVAESFTYSPDVDNAGPVYPVYIKADNPFDYQNPQQVDALVAEYDKQPPGVKEAIVGNFFLGDVALSTPEFRRLVEEGAWQVIETRPVQRLIKNLGHDGFFVKEFNSKNLAVYDPNQIKSAVGNVGTFAPKSPRILEQRRPRTAEEAERREFEDFFAGEAELIYSTRSYEAEPKPDGPFTGAKSNVVTSESVDPRFEKLLSGLMKTLGMGDVRVFLATKKDMLPPGASYAEAMEKAKIQYGMSNDYAINGLLPDLRAKETVGISAQWGNTRDFIIVYDSSRTIEQNIETIAHELGHVVQITAYNNASSDVKAAIQEEYEKWLKVNKGKTARDIVRATRNRVSADERTVIFRIAPGAKFSGEDLEYWTSFSEWFADNVSKWATTNKKPMTVVQKFFADIARKIRKIVSELTGNKFVPNKAVADFLDKMGPEDISAWLKSDTMPGMRTNYMLNAVGNRVKNLPSLTRNVYEAVRNILDSTRITDNMRSGIYAFLSLPQQVQLFAKELPKLRDLLNVVNVRASSLKDRKEVLDRNVRKWNDVISDKTQKMRDDFYRIAHESTRLVGADGRMGIDFNDPAEANNPLTKEFNALPADLKKVYFEMLQSYKDMSDEYLKLISKNLSKRAARKLERQMAQKRLKVYLPLFREGDYWLRYQDQNNETVVMSFKSNREREMAIKEAVAAGIPRTAMQEFARVEGAFQQAGGGPFFFGILDELDKRGAPQATKRALFEMYLDLIPAQSVRQQYRTRDGYKGYESDLMNVYATVASRMANQLTNLEYIPEIDKVYSEIEQEAKTAAAQSKNLAINKLMQNLELQMDYLRDPANSPLVNTLSSFSYYWYIIGNVSTALINLTQLPMVVYPMLAGKYGNVDATKAMADAQKQYMKGGWDNDNIPGGAKRFPSDFSFGIGLPTNSPLKKLYDAAVRQSAIRRSTGYDVIEGRKQNYGMGDYIGLKAKTEQVLGWVFQNSERYNREITLIAAFNLEMKKNGGKVDEAINTAIDFINDTHGTTLTETSPRVFQSGFGKVAFTFKNFAQTMIYLQAKLLRDAVKGETREVQKLAAKQFLGISAMAFTFAGIQGMPFFGAGTVIADLLHDILGDDDEPWSAAAAVRGSVNSIANKGPVNELLMADVASRTGFANLLWKDDDKRIEEVGPILFAMEQIFGPSYAAAMGIFRGYKDYKEGNYDRAVEAVTPSFIRNNLKTYRYYTEGALTRDKEVLYDNFNKYELFMQSLGFSPVEVARRSELAGDKAKKINDLENRKKALLDRMYLARISEDDEGKKEAKAAIDKFNENETVKKYGMRITPEGIISSYNTRRNRSAQSTFGIYSPPKMRRALSEEFEEPPPPILKRMFGKEEEEKKD